MESDEREKEIQSILSDLDSILQSLTGRPTAAPASEPQKLQTEPPPAQPPAREVRKEPAKAEPPKEKPKEEPPAEKPAAAPAAKIELASSGVPAAEKKGPAPGKEPAKAEPPAKLPSSPSLEITLTPAPIPVPADASSQVRRVAFLVSVQQKANLSGFSQFLSQVALKVSKRPLYIQQVLVQEVPPEMDPSIVLEKVKASGATGALGLLAGLKDAHVHDIEEAFSEAEFFLRVVNPEDALKRTAAIDLVVDLMLLKPF